MEKLGFHTSVKRLLNETDEFFERNKTFQVFLGSPRTLAPPSMSSSLGELKVLLKRRPNIEVVVHAPYTVSLCRNQADPSFIKTLKYYIQIADALNGHQIKYVTHIGARPEGMNVGESATNILWFCQKWLMATQDKDVILCLEVDSGSKKNTKMGHINILKKVVDQLKSDRVRICLDSEHAYANNMDIEDREYLKTLKDYVAVIHWNAVPKEVQKGGHLDRHSTTSFYDSVVDPKPVYDVFYDGKVPFIYEVSDDSYVLDNNKYIREVMGLERD